MQRNCINFCSPDPDDPQMELWWLRPPAGSSALYALGFGFPLPQCVRLSSSGSHNLGRVWAWLWHVHLRPGPPSSHKPKWERSSFLWMPYVFDFKACERYSKGVIQNSWWVGLKDCLRVNLHILSRVLYLRSYLEIEKYGIRGLKHKLNLTVFIIR